MINTAQQYLIDTTASLVDGYSEQLPKKGQAVVYRPTGGTTSKALSRNRQYTTHAFTAVVRGGKDSVALMTLLDSMVNALDMDNSGSIIQCNVTSDPVYAYTDDNENIHYTFNVEVLV